MPDNTIVITGYEIDTDDHVVAKQRATGFAPQPHVRSEEVIRALKALFASAPDSMAYSPEIVNPQNPSISPRHSVVRVSPAEDAAYMDAVKRPDANERTTLLAPNGKRSNLSNAQYWLVRTRRFKDWFGDWEVANLFNLAAKAWNDKSYVGKFVFAPSQKLGDKLKDLLGHEINEVVITADSVRHMKNHHGDVAYEAARGQVAMTPEDVVTLPYILNNFDVAERNPKYDLKLGNKSVDFYKRINGVSVVATISMGKEKQFVVSGWKILSAVSMSPTVAPKLNALNDADIDSIQKKLAEIKGVTKNCSKVVGFHEVRPH